jgi:hypothetical protein
VRQHITIKQLREYTKDCCKGSQLEEKFKIIKLDDYLSKYESRWLESNRKVNYAMWEHYYHEWEKAVIKSINIGKMIKVLGMNLKGINTPNSASEYSGVFLTANRERVEFKADCLCDALWKAVKYVLEKELEEEKKMEEDANV